MHLLSVFSLRNRALIALFTIVVGIFGWIGLSSLKQELIPSLSLPSVFIVTTYPGASPDVVNNDVSTPIESAIQGLENLDSTTTTSNTGSSTVTASFTYGTNISTAEQKVQLAIDRISTTLPSGVTPQVITFNFSDLPVIQLAVTSDMDKNELAAKLAKITVTNLKQLDGVSDAGLLGAATQRVTITPDVAKLAHYGLTRQSVRDALNANGSLLASGTITENGKSLTVQSGTKLASIDDLKNIPVIGSTVADKTATAAPASPFAPAAPTATKPRVVLMSQVAHVALVNDPLTGISRVNGQPSVTISVSKAASGNTVAVSKIVRDAIPTLEKQLGQNSKLTVVYDQAPSITTSINSLAEEGLLGLAFAVVVILIFLLSIRSTLVTAISIPVSVLMTFIGMLVSGYTLNVITLAALTIAIGRVVDDSIVVIENIKRHISLGEAKLQAILTAVREVAGAVTASTITTVAVFLPLALVGDITGELFRPFSLTITIALISSLFVSLTIVPVLAYWFLGNKKAVAKVESGAASGATSDDPSEILPAEKPTLLQRAYLPVIRWTIKGIIRPISVILVAILLLAGTVALGPLLKTNFIGNSGQNTLSVTQDLGNSASIEAQGIAAEKVEKALLAIKGVQTVQLSIGSGGSALRSAFTGSSASNFSVTTDTKADQTALQNAVIAKMKTITDAGVIQVTAASGGFSSPNIAVDITAGSDGDLRQASDQVLASLSGLKELSTVSSNLSASLPYIAVQVDRKKAAAAGLSEFAVGSLVTQAMNPGSSGTIVIGDKSLSIYIKNASAPLTEAALKKFSVTTATGKKHLSDLATIKIVNGPSSVTTQKGLRSATITAAPGTDNVGNASAVVAAAVAKVTLPASATATLGGVTSQQGTAFGQLGLALLAAILIVYVVMVATFKSLRQPLLLLVSVPFAATGAIALQVISGVPLGVASLIGVLMLIGIVVTNAIVLVDLINQYRAKGMRVGDAIINGASRRLRPILMTALATIFALLPLGLGLSGHGGFISQPLAIVVIGGLVSSTLLTLVVLPTLYYLVEGAKERRTERRAAKAATKAPDKAPATA